MDFKNVMCPNCGPIEVINVTHRIKYRNCGDRGYHHTTVFCGLCDEELRIQDVNNLNLLAWGKMQEGSEFYDSIGGYHSEGEGWDPHGCYCGECNKSSCTKCSNWLTRHI